MQVYTEDGASNVLMTMEMGKKTVTELSESGSEKDSFQGKAEVEPTYKDLLCFKKGYSKMMRLGFMLNILQQWSGINAILSYSTTIYSGFGGGKFLARVLTFITGLTNMVATLLVFPLIDKFGRKVLLWTGNLGMAVCLFLMGLFSDYIDAGVGPPLAFILVFLFFFEISSGPLCWVYCGEILAAKAMSLCVGTNWLCVFGVVFLFPIMSSGFGASGTFFFYSGICLFGAIYLMFDIVETRGISKPEIKVMLAKYR
mmetsp:Transcript_19942/g.19975  ORF Transcript_19942/g.19975 Transcript_19942/m.19975 type:complete len:256 (+) Transcript_19942:668-1435(+)